MKNTTDKVGKIDKIEQNKKAQAIITKASNSTNEKTKLAKACSKKDKECTKASKSKSKEFKSFSLGAITISTSAKKIAKIEAFFEKFIKNVEDKNAFVGKAILKQIKKHKKHG